MVDKPDGRDEFERMSARHKAMIERAQFELERARREVLERLARIQAETKASKDGSGSATRRGNAAGKIRDAHGRWPEISRLKRRSPWQGLDDDDPVPVEPKPNPKPLIGGAEAPVD